MKKEMFNWGLQCQYTPYVPAGRDKPAAGQSRSMFESQKRAQLCPQLRKVLIAEMSAKIPKPCNALLSCVEQLNQLKNMRIGDVVFVHQAYKQQVYKLSKLIGIKVVTQEGNVMRWE
jgi:hypothetical protein